MHIYLQNGYCGPVVVDQPSCQQTLNELSADSKWNVFYESENVCSQKKILGEVSKFRFKNYIYW